MSVATPLVEHFAQGLDAPICLTWELTYACNLACLHCLSSSGRRDPRELSTAEAKAVIDELERMQVFYVNIGGGEPTIRPDFWELVDYATAHHVGREVLHQRHRASPPRWRPGWRPATTSTCRSRSTAPPPRSTTPCGATAPSPPPSPPWRTWPPPASRASRSRSSAPAQNIGQLDAFKAHRRPLRRPAAAHPAAPLGPGRRRLGRAAPHRGPAARALRLAAGPRRGRPHRRLVLPPGRLRRVAARAQPLRRRPGRVPHRPGRRRLRLPVRHPRRVPRRQRARRRAASPACGASPSCSARCASRSRAAPAARARPTTPAGAAAWRPSSSPACRSTAPTPSA